MPCTFCEWISILVYICTYICKGLSFPFVCGRFWVSIISLVCGRDLPTALHPCSFSYGCTFWRMFTRCFYFWSHVLRNVHLLLYIWSHVFRKVHQVLLWTCEFIFGVSLLWMTSVLVGHWWGWWVGSMCSVSTYILSLLHHCKEERKEQSPTGSALVEKICKHFIQYAWRVGRTLWGTTWVSLQKDGLKWAMSKARGSSPHLPHPSQSMYVCVCTAYYYYYPCPYSSLGYVLLASKKCGKGMWRVHQLGCTIQSAKIITVTNLCYPSSVSVYYNVN
jgi:hypothetical protein